jgi:cytochrome d ubiquinol oxidase subunit I
MAGWVGLIADANLAAARSQMAISLGFHIIFAAMGIGFPVMTLIAHRRGLRKRDPAALQLAKRWSKAMAVLFAVGAVSGTILSFEMGMLWPGLMGPYGDVIGLPFALEGVSFFLEAIFIAIYLYGWNRLPARIHFMTLFPIVAAGIAGSFFVLSANAWMNSPAGFRIAADGTITDVNPLAAMFNPAVGIQYLHMLLAAYMVAGFTVAGVYAVGWLRGRRDRLHRLGFVIPFVVAAIAAPLQIVVGDAATRRLIDAQPAKFAAIELLPQTQSRAPLSLGGLLVDGEVKGAIEIPGLASWLGTHDINGVVPGLDSVAPEDQPHANIVHTAFQLMVAIGTGLLVLALWFALAWWRRRDLPGSRWFWRLAALAGVGAMIAVEAGWVTTEVGRQPWIVYGIVRTTDAVTKADGIAVSATAIALVYLALGTITIAVLRRMARRFATGDDAPAPYGPDPAVTR